MYCGGWLYPVAPSAGLVGAEDTCDEADCAHPPADKHVTSAPLSRLLKTFETLISSPLVHERTSRWTILPPLRDPLSHERVEFQLTPAMIHPGFVDRGSSWIAHTSPYAWGLGSDGCFGCGRSNQRPKSFLHRRVRALWKEHSGWEPGCYLFEITKSTVLTRLPLTVTDFSHVFGSVNTGRSTL